LRIRLDYTHTPLFQEILLPVAQDLGKDAKLSPYSTIGNEIYFYAWYQSINWTNYSIN